jgi:hypothetical protein
MALGQWLMARFGKKRRPHTLGEASHRLQTIAIRQQFNNSTIQQFNNNHYLCKIKPHNTAARYGIRTL